MEKNFKLNRFSSFRTPPESPSPKSQTTILDELVICGLCLDKLNKPKMLPCQHTFCLHCLKELVTKHIQDNSSERDINILCPMCKTFLPLPQGLQSLDDLPSNICIESLLSYMSNFDVKIKRTCEDCKVDLQLTDTSCAHCKQSYCENCLKKHANKLSEQIPNFTETLKELTETLNCRKEDFIRRSDNLKNMIHETADFKMLVVKSQEEDALEKLNDNVETTLQICEDIDKKILECSNKITNSITPDNTTSIIDHYMDLKREAMSLSELIEGFAECKAVLNKDNLHLEFMDESKERVNNIINVKNALETEETLRDFYKNHSFKPKFVWNKCPRPSGIGIPPWNAKSQLYIATSEYKSVIVLDRMTNKVIAKLQHEKMMCPISLAFSDTRKEIFVVDKWKHCIHVFSHIGDYLRTLCSRGSSDGKLISPEGITISENGHLFVCDTGNNRIVELDAENGQQLSIIGRNKHKTDLDAPTGIDYFNQKLYVADCGSNRVKVYGLNGEKAFEFGTTGTKRGELRSPESICVDVMGNILVGDCGNSRIQVFSPSGDVIKVMARPDEVVWLSDLTITKDLEIIVADHKSKKVQIF